MSNLGFLEGQLEVALFFSAPNVVVAKSINQFVDFAKVIKLYIIFLLT